MPELFRNTPKLDIQRSVSMYNVYGGSSLYIDRKQITLDENIKYISLMNLNCYRYNIIIEKIIE